MPTPAEAVRAEPDIAAPAAFRPRILAGGGSLIGWGSVAVLLIVAGLYGVGQFFPAEPAGYEWLYGGRSFTPFDADRMMAALRAAGIPCAESGGRVGVPGARKAEAFALLAKNQLAPRSLEELLDEEPNASSLFDTAEQRESRRLRARARQAEELIRDLRGVLSATVFLTPVDAGTPLQPKKRTKATAFVESDAGQLLPPSTIRMIRHILTTVDNVAEEHVTILDRGTNHEYLVAGRPGSEEASRLRAREEELAGRILSEIEIDGARVSVRMEPADSKAASPDRAVVNRPIGEISAAASASLDNPRVLRLNQPAGEDGVAYKTSVFVGVPRSHFLRLYRAEHAGASPSPSELEPLVVEVRESIRQIVHALVAGDELVELKIGRIEDATSVAASGEKEAESSRKLIPAWIPVAGGVGLALVSVVALWGGWLAARRGARAAAGDRREAPHDAAPSVLDSVRALIRRDQAAAAGVLHDWIRQGGHAR